MDYTEFERDWLRRHKGSIPQRRRVSSVGTWFWIAFWVVVAAGAAVFSAAHTIPAAELTILKDIPSRSDLAKTAFVIVELVIFGAAAGRRQIDWLKYLLGAAVLVALAGNIGSSVTAVWENGGTWLNQLGGILLSIIAPLTALAAGEVLHIQLDSLSTKRAEADKDYEVRLQALNAKINTAFSRLEKENAAVNQSNLIKNNQIEPRNKPSPKLKKAIEWLQTNTDHLDTPPRELEGEIGVSYGTIFTAQKMLKSGQFSQNGHHSGDQTHADGL